MIPDLLRLFSIRSNSAIARASKVSINTVRALRLGRLTAGPIVTKRLQGAVDRIKLALLRTSGVGTVDVIDLSKISFRRVENLITKMDRVVQSIAEENFNPEGKLTFDQFQQVIRDAVNRSDKTAAEIFTSE